MLLGHIKRVSLKSDIFSLGFTILKAIGATDGHYKKIYINKNILFFYKINNNKNVNINE